MRKPFVLIWLMLAGGIVSARGDDGKSAEYLLISLRNQQKVEFRLDSKPSISFEKDALIVKTQTGSGILSYDIGEITDVTFVASTSVDAVQTYVSIEVTDSEISMNGLVPGTAVDIFDTSGVRVVHAVASASESLVIPVAGLKGGVYIVNAGGVCYKLLR